MYTQTSPPTLAHHQSQVFTSPLSNPGTPHQLHNNGEFNGTMEFGVPYHHAAPGSVNSLTDALCPGGDTSDRQMTPGPPVRLSFVVLPQRRRLSFSRVLVHLALLLINTHSHTLHQRHRRSTVKAPIPTLQ